jgi:hypothetical protein
MAVDSLAKLKTRLAYLANRDDLFDSVAMSPATIDGEVTIAIENATKTISRDMAKRGGIGLQEVLDDTISTTGGVEYVNLPTGFAGAKAFILNTSGNQFPLLPRDYTSRISEVSTTVTGVPSRYAVIMGSTPRAYLRQIPDGVYTTRLIYWKSLVAITDSVTNPIFDNHPDIYEACGMVEIALSVDDEAAATRWRVVYDQKMNDLSSSDRNSLWASAMSGAMPQVSVTIA